MSAIPETPQFAGPVQAALGPPDESAAAAAGGLDLREAWQIIKRRKVLAVAAIVICYALVVAVTLLIWRFAPAYPSRATLLLEPPREVFQLYEELVNPRFMESALLTEAAKLKQLDLLQNVLKQPEIKETNFYKWYDDFDECLYDLEAMVRTAPIRDTYLIQVDFACRDKSEARLIVQTLLRLYMAKYVASHKSSAFRDVDSLRVTLTALNNKLATRREELDRFRESRDVPAMQGQHSVLAQYIGMLNETLSNLSLQLSMVDTQLAAIEGVDPWNLPVTPEMQIIVEADPILRYYRARVEELDVEISAAQQQQLGPNNLQIKRFKALQRGYYQKELAKREELVDQLRRRQIESLRQGAESLRAMQTQTLEQRETAEARQRELNRNIQKYAHMVEDEERLSDQIADVEKLEGEASHAQRSLASAHRLSIQQHPIEALKPSRPSFPLYLGGGAVLSVLAGLGLTFLRELTDKTIRTPIDVIRAGQLSVLGCIPVLDEEEADVDEIELATRRAPHSLVAEAFRQTRTNLLFSGPAESLRSLLITSAGPGDGKTAVAINLAVTLAQSNERVLLIDCNFRRPAIRTAFRDTRLEGLSNILIGQGRLEDLVTKADLPNLDVLSSGPMPPTPAELLSSKYMRELIKAALEQYDRVILDGPPALLVSDALVVANQVEGVILVARAVRNSKGAFRRAREQLVRINARVVGAVLNGVSPRPGGYFKQQYRDFYDYTSEETIPPALTADGDIPPNDRGTADRD